MSEACSFRRGIRQGCSISPLLFIIYNEDMIREVSHECAIGGKIVNMIRYADDKTVIASSQKGLQELINKHCYK